MIDSITILKNRDALRKETRSFFGDRQYIEVDTPILTTCPGTEIHLHYFETKWIDHQHAAHQRFLRSSPELHMKRILARGLPKIYQLGSCFRNQGEFSNWHQPEFTMLEWYEMGQSYEGLIAETETYLRQTADSVASITGISPNKILPETILKFGVFELFLEIAGIHLVDQDPELALKAIAAGVYSVQPKDDFETAYFKTLIEKIEPFLFKHKACVLMDYPPSQAALSVIENQRACRFEYYIGRIELCNGFFELTGEENNRQRIGAALQERRRLGNQNVPEDEDFYSDISRLNSPCAGNALGFDRWLALLSLGEDLGSAILFR